MCVGMCMYMVYVYVCVCLCMCGCSLDSVRRNVILKFLVC
jgi:hypothetical protein